MIIKNKGFTLIELVVVIAIIGILAALISGNFINSLKRGRDSQRKADLEHIQKALELYYEDKLAYPATLTFGSVLDDPVSGKKYMLTIPTDPKTSNFYRYCVNDLNNPQQYQLYARLENNEDKKIITPSPLTNCTGDCTTTGCNYGLASSDSEP